MRVAADLDHMHLLAQGGLELSAADAFTVSLSYSAEPSL
jgi:hypothetical protein